MSTEAKFKRYNGTAWEEITFPPSSHTHSFKDDITGRGEAFLSWGGKNFSGSYGCIDAAMVPDLGANRLAFMPASAITIEYSRDGGSSWTNYNANDETKIRLFNGNGTSLRIGNGSASNVPTKDYQVRVTINTGTASVYTVLNKFVILVSTNASSGCWCTIRCRLQSNVNNSVNTWSTFADKVSVSGWSGYNVINTSGITTYGNSPSSQYGQVQFIFGCTSVSSDISTYLGLSILKIFGYGGVGWTTPSTMATTGHLYSYNYLGNATFPNLIYSKGLLPSTTTTYDIGSSTYKWNNVYINAIKDNFTFASGKSIQTEDSFGIFGYKTTATGCTDGLIVGGSSPTYIRSSSNNLYHRNLTTNENKLIIDEGNASDILDDIFLPLKGGTMTGGITFSSSASSAWNDKGILFSNGSRLGENVNGDLGIYASGMIYYRTSSGTTTSFYGMKQTNTDLSPTSSYGMSLGTSSNQWNNIYGSNVYATNLGSSTSKITDAYITNLHLSNLGSSTEQLTNIYATDFYENGTKLSEKYVPNTRKINNKQLNNDIILYAGDIPYSSDDNESVSTKISNLMTALAGGSSSYVVNKSSNSAFDSDNDTIEITTSITTIGGETIAIADLNVGDIILVTDTKIPDRWVGAKTSTKVTLYKLEISKVALSDYLPKVTTTTTYNQAYGKLADGTQTMFNISNDANTNTLVYRDTNGKASIETPTSDKHITNKKYVDDNFVAKVGTSGKYYVYVSANNSQDKKEYTTNATANTMAYRDANGNISIATPTADGHATTKKYVDDTIDIKVSDAIAEAITNALGTAV